MNDTYRDFWDEYEERNTDPTSLTETPRCTRCKAAGTQRKPILIVGDEELCQGCLNTMADATRNGK